MPLDATNHVIFLRNSSGSFAPLTAIRFVFCTGRRKALVGAYAGTMLSWSGQAIPGSAPARCRLSGTYGGQGKAVVVTPSAALLLVACFSFALSRSQR
jgi:hypothetical protein